MKTIYLSLSICLFSFYSLSAQYQQILSEELIQYDIKAEVFDAVIDHTLLISGDTLFDNIDYKKVYVESSFTETELIGFVRESDQSDKLWFYYLEDNTEYLVMDLDLEVDDSFMIFGNDNTEVTVTSVDTVDDRKVITLEHKYGAGIISDTLEFIEGVGPNATILFQTYVYDDMPIYGFAQQVCAMYKDSLLSYPNSTEEIDCAQTPIATKNLPKANQFQLSPNPTTDFCTVIKNTNHQSSEGSYIVELYNLTGRPLFAKEVMDNQHLDISSITTGIYFYQIYQKEELVGGGKLVKVE